ncbi:MAG: GNAT family N-acetyltransferase [Brevibacterium sp.]
MVQDVDFRVRFPIEDECLSRLHARAFGHKYAGARPWSDRLQRHSLTWIGAFIDDDLVGFVHACWDGGTHSFLLDTAVNPGHQGRGIGRLLVQSLVAEVRTAGCEWLHVDYEPHLDGFYRKACGFRRTEAGLLDLTN